MIAFLTSSPTGPLDGSRFVDGMDEMNGFLEHLRQYWKNQARCLILAATPDAFEENNQMQRWMRETLIKSGLSVAVVDLWDDRAEETSEQILCSYDVVILGGGHVPTEQAFFQRLHLREKIQKFQGLVIGISAGTMNAADVVYAQPELSGEATDPSYIRFLEGLGVTKTQILPHYQMLKNAKLDGMRLYEDITFADSYGNAFLVLVDGSYLFIENGTETVHGEAYVIFDGRMEQFCWENQSREW